MRRYETIFILRPDLGEPQIKETVTRVEQLIPAGGGELIETEDWGVRELAYRIRGERRGYYIRVDYAAPGSVINEVERNLKLADTVLRYLSIMVQQDVDPAAVREEIEARHRRAAEVRAAAEAKAAAEAQAAAEAKAAAEAAEAAAQQAAEQPTEQLVPEQAEEGSTIAAGEEQSKVAEPEGDGTQD